MSEDPSNLLAISWRTLKDDGPEAYVLEFLDGQLALTFGPMPTGSVEKFLADRQKQVEEIFDRVLRNLNNGQDTTDQAEQVPDQAVSQR